MINNWLNADFMLVNKIRGAAIDGNVSDIIDDHAINERNECQVRRGDGRSWGRGGDQRHIVGETTTCFPI
jgi:hypothetical protein